MSTLQLQRDNRGCVTYKRKNVVGKQKLAHAPIPELLSDEELQRLVTRFMTTVGARIRELRQMQGLSILNIKELHGIHTSQTSRIETGQQNLTAWTTVKYAYVLGVRPWDFYVPREDAPSLKPKRHDRPLPPKAELEEETAAFRKQIGKRIRALRALQGMTMASLCEFSGVELQLISSIESGKSNFRASTAIRLADAIGVLPHELYIPREMSGIRPRTDEPGDDDA